MWCSSRGSGEPERALPRRRMAGVAGTSSVPDGDAHGTGGAGDDLRRGVDVVGVEVGHLALGDLADLRPADGRDLVDVRLAGALLDTGRLEDQARRRRRL